MNQELAILLRNKLVGLPFVEVLAGLAKTVTTEDPIGEGDRPSVVTKRFPVCADTLGPACQGKEVVLNPDSRRKSIIYFEDFGISSTGKIHGHNTFNSSLRLVCWLNRANLVGGHYEVISGRVMAAILARLVGGNPESDGLFTRLTIDVARIPPQDAALFGRYTYNEVDRQYLRPPFEFFAIDFTCKYAVSSKCLADINWNVELCT
jgi:hypothetical protein